MSPRPVDKEERKSVIATAAISIFREKGYAETTVEEIALGAGIGKGTVYEYFKSKDEIALRIFDEFFLHQEAHLNSLRASNKEPSMALSDFIRTSFDGIESYADVIPVYFEFWSSGTGKAMGLNKRMSSRFEKLALQVSKFLQKGKKLGKFSNSLDSAALSGVIISSIDGLRLYYTLYRPKPKFFSRQVEELEKVILGFLETKRN
jgi:AcrR family transcriptional regulator